MVHFGCASSWLSHNWKLFWSSCKVSWGNSWFGFKVLGSFHGQCGFSKGSSAGAKINISCPRLVAATAFWVLGDVQLDWFWSSAAKATQLSHQHQLQNPESNSDLASFQAAEKRTQLHSQVGCFQSPDHVECLTCHSPFRALEHPVLHCSPQLVFSNCLNFLLPGMMKYTWIIMHLGLPPKKEAFSIPRFIRFFLASGIPNLFFNIFFRSPVTLARWLQYMACLAQWLPERCCWAKRRIKTPGCVHLGRSSRSRDSQAHFGTPMANFMGVWDFCHTFGWHFDAITTRLSWAIVWWGCKQPGIQWATWQRWHFLFRGLRQCFFPVKLRIFGAHVHFWTDPSLKKAPTWFHLILT